MPIAFTGDPRVDFVLGQPDVQRNIRDGKINRKGQVPLLAGADEYNNSLTHIDRRFPLSFPRPGGGRYSADPHLHIHETVEKWVQENGTRYPGFLGLKPEDITTDSPDGLPRVKYRPAHYGFATPAEKASVEADGIDWGAHNAHTAGAYGAIKDQKADASPPTLYDRPYRDDNVKGLLQPSKEAAMENYFGGLLGGASPGMFGNPGGMGPSDPYYKMLMGMAAPGMQMPGQSPQPPQPQPSQPSSSILGPPAQPSTSYGPGVGYGQGQPGSFPSGFNIPPQPPQVPVASTDPTAMAAVAGDGQSGQGQGGQGGGQAQPAQSSGFFGPQNADILATLGGSLLQGPSLRQGLAVAGQQLPGVLRQSRAANATADWLARNQNIDPQTRALFMNNPQIAQAVAEAQLVPHPKQFVQDFATGEIYVADPMSGKMTKAVGNDGGLTNEAVEVAADRLLAGDTSALTNIGRGRQGAQDIRKIMNRYAEKAQAAGISGSDIAAKVAEFQGQKAGERVIGQRSAQVSIAANEATQMADQALQASAAVPRTQFVPWNQAVQAVQSGTSDPALAQFVAATNALVNTYARAITPTGTPRVSDKEHAYAMLNTAQSPEAYAAVVAQMKKEMQAAINAPADSQKQFHSLTSGQPASPDTTGEAAAAPAAQVSDPLGIR